MQGMGKAAKPSRSSVLLRFFRRLAALLAFTSLASLAATPASAAEKASAPNIIIVLADDMGYGDPGCYNPDSHVPTPHLDRLAREGMRLTDMHTPSSVCTPTRYGLLTGRYCWRTRLKRGVLDGYSAALIEPDRLTVAQLLKDHGYTTACIGKWHLGLGDGRPKRPYDEPLRPGPVTVGFDTFFGIAASLDMPPYVYLEDDRVVQPATETTPSTHPRRGVLWRGGAIAPDFKHEEVLPKLTERAEQFIDSQAGAARPFFLYFPLPAPHTPWLPTEEFRGRSRAGEYGDFATQVDATLGRVLAALDRNKLAQNTLILFTSDNGAHWTPQDIEKHGHRACGQLRGQKADIWEGGHRVPFLLRWPGKVAAGATSDQLGCLTDVMATCAAIVGAPLPQDAAEDSYNLLPVLLGETATEPLREAIVHHSFSGMFAIRKGPWKLVEGLGSGGFSKPNKIKPTEGGPTGQLYNLAEDPSEENDLFSEQSEKVEALAALLDEYRKSGRSRPPQE